MTEDEALERNELPAVKMTMPAQPKALCRRAQTLAAGNINANPSHTALRFVTALTLPALTLAGRTGQG
ncbi:hypothetical protein AS19_00530 [Alcanivorax sp. NBRC 101098]|nr:hypothetical protein AS19_00530 [Alcanivorax sp. NBRC 101098]